MDQHYALVRVVGERRSIITRSKEADGLELDRVALQACAPSGITYEVVEVKVVTRPLVEVTHGMEICAAID